jgi:hypothetical protein
VRPGLSLSRLAQKLVATNPWGQFLRLFPQALGFLNEPIFERCYLFEPAARRHGDLQWVLGHLHEKVAFLDAGCELADQSALRGFGLLFSR